MGIGDTNTAAEYAAMAYEVNATDWMLQGVLGSIAKSRRDYEAARKHFEKFVEMMGTADGLSGLRDLALAQRKFDDALRVSERMKAMDPLNPWAISLPINVLIVAGRFEEAEEQLERELESLTREEDRQRLIQPTIRMWLRMGEVARAERFLKRWAGLNPDPEDTFEAETKARIASYTGRYDEALEHLERARAIRPVHADRFAMGLQAMHGDLEGAEQTIRGWLAEGPVARSSYESLAVILAGQGRFAEALPVAEKSLAMEDNRSTNGLVAWVLVAGDLDLERGIELAEAGRAIPPTAGEPGTLAPDWPSPEHALGLARMKQGRFDEAVTILEEAARRRPRRPLIREHLAAARKGEIPD